MRHALVMMVVFGCMTTGCATKTASQPTEEEALRLAQIEDRNRPQRIVIQATRTQQQPARPAVPNTTRPSESPASTSASSPARPSNGTPISQAGATGAAAPSGQASSTPASPTSTSQASQSSCSPSQTSSSSSGGSPGNDPSQSGAGNAALSAVTPPPSKGGGSSSGASSSAPAVSPSSSGPSGQQSPAANNVAGVVGATGSDGQSGTDTDSEGDDASTSNQRQSSKAGRDDGSPMWLVPPEKVGIAADQSPLGQPTPDTSGVVETPDIAGDGGGQGGQAGGSSASDSQGGAGGEAESDEAGGGSGSQSNDGTKAEPPQPSASGVSSPDQEQGDGVGSGRSPLTLSSLASSDQQSPNSSPLDIDDAALSDTRNTTGGMLDERPDHRDALRGVWRLVHIDGDARRDFLPTGADERFIGLDPDNEEITVILSWGDGDVVLMADYQMQASPSQMVIRASGNHASRLPGRDTVMPGGGRLIGPSSEPPWTLDWSRHGNSLRIGGCLYSASDPDTLDVFSVAKVDLHRTRPSWRPPSSLLVVHQFPRSGPPWTSLVCNPKVGGCVTSWMYRGLCLVANSIDSRGSCKNQSRHWIQMCHSRSCSSHRAPQCWPTIGRRPRAAKLRICWHRCERSQPMGAPTRATHFNGLLVRWIPRPMYSS